VGHENPAVTTAQTDTRAVWIIKPCGSSTSGLAWIARHGLTPAVPAGEDCMGHKFRATTVRREVEHTAFAGAQMVRFGRGAPAPRDCNRPAMYAVSYLAG
jgi:hypothetical protein